MQKNGDGGNAVVAIGFGSEVAFASCHLLRASFFFLRQGGTRKIREKKPFWRARPKLQKNMPQKKDTTKKEAPASAA